MSYCIVSSYYVGFMAVVNWTYVHCVDTLSAHMQAFLFQWAIFQNNNQIFELYFAFFIILRNFYTSA
jgi:hypothetical protein